MTDEPGWETPGTTTVAGGAVAKYLAEAASLSLSLATGIFTARNLGPARKGDLATIGYLAVVVASASALGLGEAAVNVLARTKTRFDQVVASTLALLTVSTLVGTLLYLALGAALFAGDLDTTWTSILLVAGTVPAVAAGQVLSAAVDAQHQFFVSSMARTAAPLVTAVATWLLVIVADRGLAGASLGLLVGWLAMPLVLLVALARRHELRRPRWDGAYNAAAIRLGARVQLAQLLMAAVTRVDLLVVHLLRDGTATGEYSVALTLGSLNTYAALALAGAAFPRIASIREDEVGALVFRITRATVLVAVLVAIPIALALPWLVPTAFGHGFRGATPPAWILLASGIPWSAQFVLCRARAARGDGRPLVRSFGLSLVTMLAADVVLVPTAGITGAAVAVVLATVVGAASIARTFGSLRTVVAALVPRGNDVRELVETLRRLAATRT